MKTALPVLVVVIATLFICPRFSEGKGLMPVAPEVLFKALPREVEGWKLTVSKGRQGKSIWLESTVTREFIEILNEKVAAERKPGKTRLTILDTAKFRGGDLDLFANFKPVKYPRAEYLFVKGFPAIILEPKSGKLTAQLLIGKRWILTIQLENQERDAFNDWFNMVRITSLRQIKDGPKVKRPDRFVSVSIDELTGKTSKGMSVSGAAEAFDEGQDPTIYDGGEENPE